MEIQKAHFLEYLNESQSRAVTKTDGPVIIFAGAGTGKTRVITYRIAHLLASGVPPSSILAVTFTNKAAEEMRRRVDTLSPGKGRAVWISTFHSFGARFLKAEAKDIGINPEFLIYDDKDQKKVVLDCLRNLNLDEKKFKPSRVIEIISRAKDDLLDADSYSIHSMASGDTFRQTIASIYSLYQKKLKTAGALDFGDLLQLTVNALHENAAIKDKYQKRFKYIMVDEYQDTNHAQYLLTKYLSNLYKNICVVGDDDQSIYSWRGADIKNILDFEKDHPNCTMIKLEKNYRSTQNILKSAWNVIKNNIKRVDKKLWSEKEPGAPIKYFESLNELEEAGSIASEINHLMDNNLRYSDIAVFYRTNAQSRVLEDAFRREGIPYKIVGSLRFYKRAEVKDILAYLRLIHNPNDSVSFKRVINVPKRGVGKTSMEALEKISLERGISLYESINFLGVGAVTKNAHRSILSFRNLIDEVRLEKNSTPVKNLATALIEKTCYIDELEAEDTSEAKSRIENIHELVSAIDEFERISPDTSLSGYLTNIALVNDIDEWDASCESTTLMTLHLAKGLEFNSVFITGLEEGLFPIGEASFDTDELEEERRLMYVGMTRAKEKLYLSWAAERKIFGKSRWNIQSRFIDESKILQSEREDNTVRRVRVKEEKDASGYSIGSRVRHEKFGDGKIIEKSGSGDELKLVVLFDTGAWKKLIVKYANLQTI